MIRFATMLCVTFTLSTAAFAQDKQPKKPVSLTPQQQKEQARAKDCVAQAEKRKIAPEKRLEFVNTCMRPS